LLHPLPEDHPATVRGSHYSPPSGSTLSQQSLHLGLHTPVVDLHRHPQHIFDEWITPIDNKTFWEEKI